MIAEKSLLPLNDACEHARKLIHKILFHVGDEDAETWKVVILNDEHDAQMIIPFSVSHAFRAQDRTKNNRKAQIKLGLKFLNQEQRLTN